MSIVETSWQQFLAPDSEVPPDVFFLVKSEDEGVENDSSRPIGDGVRPGFRTGILKETGEVI